MTAIAQAHRTPVRQLREARRQLVEDGEPCGGLLEPLLQASWRRSREFGLAPDGRMPGAPHASAAQLARALEHRHALVAHARPVMEFLCEQIRDTDSMVILADPQGMLLHSLGDADFAEKAARVALRPGAIWHEQWRGTNAIGTALADGMRGGRARRRALSRAQCLPDLRRRADRRSDRPAARRARHLRRPSRPPSPHARPGALGGADDRAPAVPGPPCRRPAAAAACAARRHRHRHRGPARHCPRMAGSSPPMRPHWPCSACTPRRSARHRSSACCRSICRLCCAVRGRSGRVARRLERSDGSVLWLRLDVGRGDRRRVGCRGRQRGPGRPTTTRWLRWIPATVRCRR